jgi:hypothetical protein
MTKEFRWWRVTEHGTAEPVDDSPAVRAQIDRDSRGWYASIEGAILRGGVQAVAIRWRNEEVFDAAALARARRACEILRRMRMPEIPVS